MKNFQRIIGAMHRAIDRYKLIEDGDKIAVGISGGKDSLCLLKALCLYSQFSKTKFTVVPIMIDLFNGEHPQQKIIDFCEQLGTKLHIVKTEINKVVFQDRKESNPCSLCAKMRRGSLNNAAVELGCNKVALGHHADDLMETFFLSMIYEGRLSTFLPITYLSNTNLYVIRPFLFVKEQQIIEERSSLPVFKNPCIADHNTQREEVKKLIENMDKKYNCKNNIFNAIIEKNRYNLFDKINN